jgi:hypothetical protein
VSAQEGADEDTGDRVALVQSDLFGELDRAEERSALWAKPATCPSCGATEPNAWLLQTNHGYRPDEAGISGFPLGEHPIYSDMCTAQFLVRNHIVYHVHHPEAKGLAERMERGRALGLDVDTIVAAAQLAMEASS